ncbi:MAG: CocE/NonD family hydrolase [Deltaproteobacteria bacterium]|nr:CocE/NonD family hydrolase [Deltaproteobacteria bacterium]
MKLVAALFVLFALACDSDSDGAGDAATQTTTAPDASDTTSVGDDTTGPDAPDTPDPDVAADVAPDVGPPHPALVGTEPATFTVRPGVEIATVLGAAPGTHLTLYDAAGARLITVVADEHGHGHFAYVPDEYGVYDLTESVSGDLVKHGSVLASGDGYVVRDDDADPPRAGPAFRVLAVDDHPDPLHYEGQTLVGIHYGLLGLGQGEVEDDGFNYITMRDGVKLGAMVRFPDEAIWGPGPYPTVVEYSGYAPSDPLAPDPASRIATLLGFASVGVNMRGTGCSGGVFDVFSPAQHADGYDVIEVIARQSWVKGGKVGMVGLSYPGISQLYVAYTRPPSLAAIAPQSVLADPWQQLRPGGIFNDGFTRQWLENRDAEAAPNGQSWTDRRIGLGDTICEEHQHLRMQNLEFESFFKALEFYPDDAEARSLPGLVGAIEVPVLLTGAFQDEQTGAQFGDMLDRFGGAAVRRFIVYNGRHPDGYSPLVLTRWWEFLELYVAERVPRLPVFVRDIGGPEIDKQFDSTGLGFEPDRFASFEDDDYAGVRAAYEAEPEVRVLFENGGDEAQPGAPRQRFEASYSRWPPAEATSASWWLDGDGALATAAPVSAAVDMYAHDPAAGADTFFGAKGYELLVRLWSLDWRPFPEGKSLSYLTPALEDDVVLAGPGYAELWMSSDAADVNVQVTITEVREDGNEVLVQSGWHRIGHRVEVASEVMNRIAYTWTEEDFAPLGAGEVLKTRVPIPPVAHAFRAGSRLRVVVSTPGRDHGTWEFDNPDYGGATPNHYLHRGGATPSRLVMSVVDGVGVAEGLPACPGLRGQPCRVYTPSTNLSAPTE